MVENIEGILTIEKHGNCRYLLKSEENAEVSVGCSFGANRFQVPPSAPFSLIALNTLNDHHSHSILDALVRSRKWPFSVIPAKAGIQFFRAVTNPMDSGFHRSDDFLRDCQFLGNDEVRSQHEVGYPC